MLALGSRAFCKICWIFQGEGERILLGPGDSGGFCSGREIRGQGLVLLY
jgi:hypothetical protein